MKITKRDLDSTIIEKLDLLDNVIATYDPNSDGFVSYGKSGFYFKKTNDTFLKKVFNEDELVDLEEQLGKIRKNITNSSVTDMRLDETKFNLAVKSFLHSVNFGYKKTLKSKIALSKFLPNNVLILTDDGNLIRIAGESESTIELVSLLRSNFNISAELAPYNVVDIAEIDEDNVVIVTEDFGIYKLKLSTKELILVTLLNGVRKAIIDKTGALFVATREFVARYDLESGKRIEKYGNLARYHQIPREITKTSKGIFVLGDSCGVSNMDNLLHFWALDKENLGYNLRDNQIPRNPIENAYQVLYACRTNEDYYLAGKYNNQIFIWQYSLNDNFRMTETFIDCLENTITTMDGFVSLDDDRYLILSKDVLYLVKNNIVIEALKLPGNCKGLYLHKNELMTISGNSLTKIELPVFEAKPELLSFKIFECDEPCNNIDIFVKNAGRSERISLIDMDTNKEILPSFYAVFNGSSIIKLMNCQAKRIKMLISVTANSSLGGIVVKNNKMFLR